MKLPFDESRDSIQSMAAQHSKTVTYWMGGEYSSNMYLPIKFSIRWAKTREIFYCLSMFMVSRYVPNLLMKNNHDFVIYVFAYLLNY